MSWMPKHICSTTKPQKKRLARQDRTKSKKKVTKNQASQRIHMANCKAGKSQERKKSLSANASLHSVHSALFLCVLFLLLAVGDSNKTERRVEKKKRIKTKASPNNNNNKSLKCKNPTQHKLELALAQHWQTDKQTTTITAFLLLAKSERVGWLRHIACWES